MKTAIYARVSTSMQDPTMQLEECRQYCAARGWAPISEWVDTASGGKESRRELDRMMQVVKRGGWVVVVYRFDRFARSLLYAKSKKVGNV
jgi:DNA invertase Pin-like site-specific DNA recombinase